MPKTFWEDWIRGPHDPKGRSRIGAISWAITQSIYWEYIFLAYILFNAVMKLTYLRILPEEHTKLLADVGLYAVIIFNAEWVFEILTYGYYDFFADNWYKADTMVNVMNVGSFLRDTGTLVKPFSDFVPNVAFLRMLRMLKPLGRVKFLFPSKVVVKTVAAALQSMGPVISLVAFAMFFFGVAGIYIFGAKGELYYRCGVALELNDALSYYDPNNYHFDLHRGMQVMNCQIDMDRYREFLALRGQTALGNGKAPEEADLDEPGRNISQAIETMANFSADASAAERRRLLAFTDDSKKFAVQVFNEVTGVYDTNYSTFKMITRVIGGESTCGQDESIHVDTKMEERYVVDGVEMSASEFRDSPQFKGRYLWLGQQINGGEAHRRARARARRSAEEDEGEDSEFDAFQDVKCIVVHPPRICTCIGTDDVTNAACIDPVCPHSLCFTTESPPINKLHGFSNIISASLTVIAIFFQKNWSLWMEKSAESNPGMAYFYYLFVVILGSFCLLNLTVATVGQNYSRVKEEAEAKKAVKEAEAAARAKIQAERDDMKKSKGGDEGGGDEEGEEVIVQLWDTSTCYWYWLLGFVGLPFVHRIHLKLYNVDSPPGVGPRAITTWPAPFKFSMFWFVLRCLTLNYGLLGWILDGLQMNALNDMASEAEKERIELWTEATNQFFLDEIERLSHNMLVENGENLRLMIGKCLLYPIDDVDDFPWSNSREFLEEDYEQFKIDNKDVLDALGLLQEDNQSENASQVGLDEDLSAGEEGSEDEEEGREEDGAAQKPTQSYFAWFADFVVVANAATLAMEGFDDSIQAYLDIVGYFASFFFIFEAIVKSYAYGGFTYYTKDGGNLQDFILVIMPSIGEVTTITTATLGLGEDYVYPMLAVQATRVFRITKLTKHLTGLKRLTSQAFGSPEGVAYALAVTIIFIIFMSLFGNELFRDSVSFAVRRNDFQYILSAIKAMIEFLFGESYFINLEIGNDDGNVIGVIFFVAYFYIANYLVLRMFIALILENFEFDQDKRVAIQIQLFQKRQVERNDLIDGTAKAFPIDEQKKRLEKQNLDPDHLRHFQDIWEKVVQDRAAENGKSTKVQNLWDVIIDAAIRDGVGDVVGAADQESLLQKLIRQITVKTRETVYDIIENQYFNLFVASCIIFSVVLLQVDPPEKRILDPNVRSTIDRSLLGFFTVELFAKMFAFGVTKQPIPIRRTLEHPGGMPPFFSSSEEGGWNMIDFVFICISYMDMLGVSIGNFKTIRIVRVVRPMQKNIPTVKGLLAALFSSFMNILHVFNLLILLMIIWGLMGISLFRGRFHSCNDLSARNFGECVGTSYGGLPSLPCDFMDPRHPNGTQCDNPIGVFLEQSILVPRVWSVPHENFDNMLGATHFLFRLLCVDNLRPMFHSLMDIPAKTELICSGGGPGHAGCPIGEFQYVVSEQPQMDNKPENILFAIVYLFAANAFISQLVIGVLIDNIRQQTGTALFTDQQRIWDSTGKTILKNLSLPRKATKPEDMKIIGPIALYGRVFLYKILMSDTYDSIMMAIIIINTLWMATEHWPAEPWYHELKGHVNITFVYVYMIETVAKIYSFGVIGWQDDLDPTRRHGDSWILKTLKIKEVKSPYFGDPWCMFDFFVVALSVVMTFSDLGDVLAPLKLLRVLRVFRLVKKIKQLQVMISTLIGAVPSIISALFFLAIWIFLFSAVGMQYLPRLKHGEVINQVWNFRDIMSSMMLLFRISTGDAWFPIIYDASVVPPYCTDHVDIPCDPSCDTECDGGIKRIPGDCGGPVAYVFFFIFWFGCNFAFGPLFVATLIDYFFESQINEDSLFNADECELYAKIWSEFDEDLCGRISIENLRPLIERLCDSGSRVGFRVASERERYKQIWAKVMTDPEKFPGEVQIPEEFHEELGLTVIDRETVLKAFPNNTKSKRIRAYIYDHSKVRPKEEVAYKYCAKVLLIHQNGIQAPITTSNLVNQGASLQQFMGFLGLHDGVKGRDGNEKRRWEALEVHHNMVQAITEKSGKKRKTRNQVADVSQLPRITQAMGYVKLELKPPPPTPGSGEEPTPKPTGDKREALIEKVNRLNSSFDDIAVAAIENLLYGADDGGSHQVGILDVLLNHIIDHTVHQFAVRAVESIDRKPYFSFVAIREATKRARRRVSKQAETWEEIKCHRFAQGRMTKNFSKQKRYSINILEQKAYEPIVTTVPRGWLNSHRKSRPKRLAFSPDIQDEAEDKTNRTLEVLSRMAPARPKRMDSVRKQELSRRSGVDADRRSNHLRSRMQELDQNQVWRQMFHNTLFADSDQPPPPPKEGHAKDAFSWREHYSAAMDSVAQRISQRRPELQPHEASVLQNSNQDSDAMQRLMTLGSMVGLCSAPARPDEHIVAPQQAEGTGE